MGRITPLQKRMGAIMAQQQQDRERSVPDPIPPSYPIVLAVDGIDIPFPASVDLCEYKAERGGIATSCDIAIASIKGNCTFKIYVNGNETLTMSVSDAGQHSMPIQAYSFREGDIVSVVVETDSSCSISSIVIVFLFRDSA